MGDTQKAYSNYEIIAGGGQHVASLAIPKKSKKSNSSDRTPSAEAKTLANYSAHEAKAEKAIRNTIDSGTITDFQKAMQKMVDDGSFYAARSISSVLDAIETHYKAQPETLTSSGMLNPTRRIDGSKTMFGHSGVKASDYEKYGFLGSSDLKDMLSSAPHYGGYSSGAIIEFDKSSLLGRTTVTVGDTLDSYRFHVTPSLIDNAGKVGITAAGTQDSYMRRVISGVSRGSSVSSVGDTVTYFELQYHGKVDRSNMKGITLRSSRTTLTKAQVAKIKGYGLYVKRYENGKVVDYDGD